MIMSPVHVNELCHQKHASGCSPRPLTEDEEKFGNIVGFGDAVLDIIARIPDEDLHGLRLELGGCLSVGFSELEALLSIPVVSRTSRRLPGGSAANVCKCLTALGRKKVDFVGMVGNDSAGDEYRAALSRHQVRPVLSRCCSDAPTAMCLCLITPDGERTMRTFLGAAMEFSDKNMLPSDIQMTKHGLLHCEGYALYRPDITKSIMQKAQQAHSRVSLDLASFEVVKTCFSTLKNILETGLVDIVFCNEDEARALSAAAEATNGSKFLRQLCADATVVQKSNTTPEIEIAQAWLLQHTSVVVISRGKKGCCVANRAGERTAASADAVMVVDTVGAGDFFSAGFLHAWVQGADLETCARCGCACGSAIVQVQGAELPHDAAENLRKQVTEIVEIVDRKWM